MAPLREPWSFALHHFYASIITIFFVSLWSCRDLLGIWIRRPWSRTSCPTQWEHVSCVSSLAIGTPAAGWAWEWRCTAARTVSNAHLGVNTTPWKYILPLYSQSLEGSLQLRFWENFYGNNFLYTLVYNVLFDTADSSETIIQKRKQSRCLTYTCGDLFTFNTSKIKLENWIQLLYHVVTVFFVLGFSCEKNAQTIKISIIFSLYNGLF